MTTGEKVRYGFVAVILALAIPVALLKAYPLVLDDTPSPPNPTATPQPVPRFPPLSSTSAPRFPRKNRWDPACSGCDGTGVDRRTWSDTIPSLCGQCGGSGLAHYVNKPMQIGQPCAHCSGTGWREYGPTMVTPCPSCNGHGTQNP